MLESDIIINAAKNSGGESKPLGRERDLGKRERELRKEKHN